MNRLARPILEAPAPARRATGAVLVAVAALAVGLGGPVTAQSSGPAPFAGSADCVGPDDERLVDDQGRAVLHGTTWGVPLAADGSGGVYAADSYMIRRIPPAGAPAVYTGSPTDAMKGVAVMGSQVFWTETTDGTVRVRTPTGPAAATTVVTGPSAGGETTRGLGHGLAVATDGTLYVAVPAAGQVYRVGGGGLAPVSSTALEAPQSIAAVEEDGGTVLYVAGRGSRVMRVVAATGAATPVGPTLTPGAYSARVAADPVDRQLFVADRGGIFQIDLPTGEAARIVSRGGDTSGLAVVRSSAQGEPRLVFANWNVATGRTVTRPNPRPGEPDIEEPEVRCDLQSVVPNSPPKQPPSSVTPTTATPTTIGQRIESPPAQPPPKLNAPAGDPQPLPNNNPQQQAVTDPQQLVGTRAEGDFGQFNPLAGTQGGVNSQFTPLAAGGGQNLGGFAPSAASDPFSGAGAFSGSGPGPAETAAAGSPAAPPAAVANPGPVGVAAPPPAAAPLGGASAAPVQGWPGAPAEPVQGATRYAMIGDRPGPDPFLYGLVGLGGWCLLVAGVAGTGRGGGSRAPAPARADRAAARAWAVGR